MYEMKILEYDKILNIISDLASIDASKEKIKKLQPIKDYEAILLLLNETEEARRDLVALKDISFGLITNCESLINKARINGVLNGLDVLKIQNLLNSYTYVKEYFKNVKNEGLVVNYLEKYLTPLLPLNELKTLISNTIDEAGNVLDSADNELFTVRKQLKVEQNRLRNKLTEIVSDKAKLLTEQLIVIRNNRYCVPVKVEFKNTFKGVIQDTSASGTTIYIEPYSTIEISNRITTLENKDHELVEKILRILSLEIGQNSEALLTNLRQYIELDVVFSKAKYACKINGFMPTLNNDGIIDLIKARHPLIDSSVVVPLDINLGDKYQTIIITGPNTGGKTVALKTVGLLTLMNQTGILIPALEGSKMAIFDNVFADIGDEQSIEQSLSTFSSHMKKIISIVDNFEVNSLVLLDELGSGTDPKEGSSLARAILNYLRNRGARTIITTHYSELKSLAYSEKNIINASVEFDLDTLSPTYRMLLGIPGKSNALEISKRLGLKSSIIDEAKKEIVIQNDSLNIMIGKLESEGLELEKKTLEYSNLIIEAKKTIEEYKSQSQIIENEKKQIIEKAKQKAEKIVIDARDEASIILEELKKLKDSSNVKEHVLADIKHQLSSLKVEGEEVIKDDHEISVGDNVYVIPYQNNGVVQKIYRGTYTVALGNLNATFSKNELNYVGKAKKKDKPKSMIVSSVSSEAKLELDLRGYRYEDAVIELDHFIDRAIYANYSLVYIIHGFGTGAIRKAVTDYLKKCPQVKSFRFGGEGEGLNGVTVAYLK